MLGHRGSGRTSLQIKTAPFNAIFVWCNMRLDYPAELARRLGRDDLEIVSSSQVENALAGAQKAVVYDHACGTVAR